MAQTKRKRRSKHRGNAAGVVEARGRTGRRPTEEELRKQNRESVREARRNKPPTWNSALLKAALMAGLLFVFTRLGVFGSDTTVAQSLILCFFALLLYTPIAYMTDRFVYTRAQRRMQRKS
jgi:drug/metabolite transporter (DMT)-like permease